MFTDLSPVYYAAVALNPEMKLQDFREEWKDRPDRITTAEHAVKTMSEEGYKGAPALQIIEQAESSLESSQQIESTSQLTAGQKQSGGPCRPWKEVMARHDVRNRELKMLMM